MSNIINREKPTVFFYLIRRWIGSKHIVFTNKIYIHLSEVGENNWNVLNSNSITYLRNEETKQHVPLAKTRGSIKQHVALTILETGGTAL